MVESGIVLLEDRIIDFQIGTPTTVEFDFLKIWHESRGYPDKLLHFIHMHPEGCLYFSSLDEQIMSSMRIGLGRDFLFSVITYNPNRKERFEEIHYHTYLESYTVYSKMNPLLYDFLYFHSYGGC